MSKRGVAEGREHYEWLDDRRVLCSVLPEGKLPEDADQFWGWVPRPMNPLLEGWKKTFEDKLGDELIGKQSAASVLQAGIQQAPPDELRQLLIIDTVTKVSTVVMDTYRPADGFVRFQILVSPGNEHVAFYRYAPEDPGKFYGERMGLEIRRLDGKPLVLDKPLPETYVQSQTVRWSVDGTELMYFTYTGSRGDPVEEHAAPKMMVVDLKQGKVRERSLGKLDARPVPAPGAAPNLIRAEWTEKGDIVVLVLRPEFESLQGMDRSYGDARPINEGDWWLIPRTGEEPRVLTAGMKTVPNFSRRSRQGPLIGYMDGELWRMEVDGKLTNLTANFAPKLDLTFDAIAWPSSDNEIFRHIGQSFVVPREERPKNAMVVVAVPLVITSTDGTQTRRYSYHRVDTNTGAMMEMPKPGPEARLKRMDPEAQVAFYQVETNAAKRAIWKVPVLGGKPELMFTLNAWREIVQVADTGEFIDYVDSLTGKPLKGILYLPQMYEKGKQYPLIVNVYPLDLSKRGSPKEPFQFEERTAGFAVMRPSVVIQKDGSRDRLMDVAGGILPAVDKMVERGIADPERLFIEGGSQGGFTTFTMVTQTTRFKAAYSLVGISNWMSFWGTFGVYGRYREDASRLRIGWGGEALGPDRPANHNPWEDQAFYLKNSPISYVDRVRTPILIVSNDMDTNVPMSQSDEFFAALYRMNKRAQYVRYWGEGHGVGKSHANMRDLLQRRLAWYDEFGDIGRDELGNVIWEGKRVKGRDGKPPLKPEDYLKFDLFGKGGPDASPNAPGKNTARQNASKDATQEAVDSISYVPGRPAGDGVILECNERGGLDPTHTPSN